MPFSRLLVLVALLAGVAVLAPKVAPGLLAAVIDDEPAPGTVAADAPAPRNNRTSGRSVVLDADERGHFLTEAVINGRRVEMMVDTGATIVALTETTARRLGITPARSAFTDEIATANGVVMAAPVVLPSMKVGGITVRDVAASVVSGSGLGVDLLGMSFLQRLSKFEIAGSRLRLVE